MTDQTPETPAVEVQPVIKTVQQFRGNDDDISESEARQIATNRLRNMFRQEGMSLDAEPVASPPWSARLINGGTGFEPWTGMGKPDGQVIVWTASGTPAVTDPAPLSNGTLGPDGAYMVAMPPSVHAAGGPVRVRHMLNGPVLVSAFGDNGAPIGYLFTTTIDADEEHVEVMATTTMLRIAREPQAPYGGV